MSGDIFKKAFSESVDKERQRSIKLEKERQIEIEEQRERIGEIRDDVESVISQIPTVFAVSNVTFESSGSFDVGIPVGNDSYLFVHIDWSIPGKWLETMLEEGSFEDRYIVSIGANNIDFSLDPESESEEYISDPLYRESVSKWLGSELGRILGEEYERHRDFYEKMEKGR